MHNPSDETEQYDEPETIVQRHGGVELPFKHHEGGTAGGGDRGVDEAIKESSPLHPLWRELHTRTRRQVWKLKPNEPNLVKIEARTLGPSGSRTPITHVYRPAERPANVGAHVVYTSVPRSLRVDGRREGGRCGTAHPLTHHPVGQGVELRVLACRAPDVRQMRVSLAYSRVCSRSVDLDGAVDLEHKPPRGEEADGACGEREQR